jgi:DNA-binding NarL/FixJ family response regulator
MKTKTKIQSPPNNDEFTGRAIRTFLADDDPFVLALLARLLARDPRITIIGSATDGRKALHSAAMSCPDLVLTDLHMPIVDGVEVTRWLKQLRNPPIIFMVTSDDTPEALTRSLSAGADAFLVKAADLHIQLQMAMEDFFPGSREQEKQAQSQSYELATATN